MGFGGYRAPGLMPEGMQAKLKELEAGSNGPEEFLQAVYAFCQKKWQHNRFSVVVYLPKIFRRDINRIWQDNGFVHCNTMNFMANTLISNSKFFQPEDVRVRHVFLNFVPHQYLQVKLGEKWLDFDPAGAGIRNRPLGVHASLFG